MGIRTLRGRNAFGGAINYVTRRAPDYLTGNGEITLGSGGQKTLKGSIGGAIVEGMLSANIAGAYDKFDGTYKDSVNGLRRGEHEKKEAAAQTVAPSPQK